MNIAIDISHLHADSRYRGIGVHAYSLYEALRNLDSPHTFSLYIDINQAPNADVIHYPHFDFFAASLPWSKQAPTVVTIHDVIPLIYPQHYKPGIKGKFNYLKQRLSLQSVDHVITLSSTSKADISHYLACPPAKITSIALAGNPRLTAQKLEKIPSGLHSLAIKQPFYLYVGDINYNKNIPYLLKGFAALSQDHQLVMVSKAMANDIPEAQMIKQMIDQLKIGKRVVMATDIPAQPIEPLLWLYQHAQAYIQPSLYEGFGLPVLEALSCSTLVISSTGGSLKEFSSPAIFTIDPLDPASLTQALEKVNGLTSNKRADLVGQGIAYAQTFSWHKCAQETLKVYERCYAKK